MVTARGTGGKRHWDPVRVDELIRAAAPATLYVCGGADNGQELAARLTQVFLPEIDEPAMLAWLWNGALPVAGAGTGPVAP